MHETDNLIGILMGGIWSTPGVSEEPEITMVRWRVMEVQDPKKEARGRHVVGYSIHGHEGRASSTIVEFDSTSGRVVTRSGRVYQLVGRPGVDLDGDWVWRQWSRLKGFRDEKDVTEEYMLLLAAGGTPGR